MPSRGGQGLKYFEESVGRSHEVLPLTSLGKLFNLAKSSESNNSTCLLGWYYEWYIQYKAHKNSSIKGATVIITIGIVITRTSSSLPSPLSPLPKSSLHYHPCYHHHHHHHHCHYHHQSNHQQATLVLILVSFLGEDRSLFMAHCFSWEPDHFLSCPLTDFALSVTPSFLYLLLFSFQNIHLKYCNKDTAITYCILTQCHISFHTFSAPGFLFHSLYSFKFCSQFSSSKTVLAGVTDKSVYFYCVAILCSLKTWHHPSWETLFPSFLNHDHIFASHSPSQEISFPNYSFCVCLVSTFFVSQFLYLEAVFSNCIPYHDLNNCLLAW